MVSIQAIRAWEVLNSRGEPTVCCEVELSNGHRGLAYAPSGASKGKREAHECLDEDPSRFGGKGVLSAINHIEEIIAPKLCGQDAHDQQLMDSMMIELLRVLQCRDNLLSVILLRLSMHI